MAYINKKKVLTVVRSTVNVDDAGSGAAVDYLAMRLTQTPYEYSNSEITTLKSYGFMQDFGITKVDFPNVTSIEMYGINNCENLISVNLPNLTAIANVYAIHNCYNLKSIAINNITSLISSSIYNCYSLLAVIITQTTSIPTVSKTSFYNCCHILGTTNETYNPTGAKDGYIYVPDSLVEQYKSDTNWSVYASQIKPLSELPQEYIDLYGIEIPEADEPNTNGYTVTLNTQLDYLSAVYGAIYYSLDDGSNWTCINESPLVLENVSTIKFNSEDTAGLFKVGTTDGGGELEDGLAYGETENFTITEDTVLYLTRASYGDEM